MTDQDDIVARLRAVLHNDRSVELMNREAAHEIERLRDERDALLEERGRAKIWFDAPDTMKRFLK